MNRIAKLAVIALASIAFAACGDDGDNGTDTGPAATTDTGGGGGVDFAAGTFQLTTHEVSDACLDGALDLLFMPNGSDKPYDLANTTEIPGRADLPKTYDIQLQAPFAAMTVTVEADGGNMKIVGAQQEDVVVDANSYGDCTADMTINANIVVADKDNIDVTATISIAKFESAADQKCPTPKSEPCAVTLTMKGKRQ